MKESCRSCRFSLKIAGFEAPNQPPEAAGTAVYVCRRFPPAQSERPHAETPVEERWPVVGADDWCGEYKQKQQCE